jgi:hypothetical protein
MTRAELRRRLEAVERQVRHTAEVEEECLDFSILPLDDLLFLEQAFEQAGPGPVDWYTLLKSLHGEEQYRARALLQRLIDAPPVKVRA